MSAFNEGRSSWPSGSMGVTIATKLPCNIANLND
jgi:hypothetical protein